MERYLSVSNGLRILRWMVFTAAVFAFILACAGRARAQGARPPITMVAGEVRSEQAVLPNDLVVELVDMQHYRPTERAPIAGNGRFEFRNVEGGYYQLRVTTWRGDTVHEQVINIMPYSPPIQVLLRASREARPTGGVVSVHQLKPSGKAGGDAEPDRKKALPYRMASRLWRWLAG